MSRSAAEFLRDAKQMGWNASTYSGLSADTWAESEARYSVVYCLIIIGEALNNVPPAIRSFAPDLPWKAIINLRHILVHNYWRTDYVTLQEIVRRDLDPLIAAIDRLLSSVERS